MEQKDRIDQLVAENQELLALTKQAFVKREVEKESETKSTRLNSSHITRSRMPSSA